MIKRYIKIFSVFVLLVSITGCSFRVINKTVKEGGGVNIVPEKPQDVIVDAEKQKDDYEATSSMETDVKEETDESRKKRYESLKRESFPKNQIDTSNWQTFRSEEYGFEIKYPENWYWEDYAEDFRRPMFGFYSEGHKRGYEYYGDIAVGLLLDRQYDSVIEFYEEGIKKNIELSEKRKIILNKNKQEVFVEYDDLGFSTTDRSAVLCNNNIIDINSFSEDRREIFNAVIDSFICTD